MCSRRYVDASRRASAYGYADIGFFFPLRQVYRTPCSFELGKQRTHPLYAVIPGTAASAISHMQQHGSAAFHKHGYPLASADAQGSKPALLPFPFKRMQESDKDASAGSAYGVPQRYGSAVDVDVIHG